jgi:16S rRNA (guanine966-N2)-methyltransferase
MRIIAGTKRGMKLFSPKAQVSRPILDRVKESLFNVLYKYDLIQDRKIADLFSGVGSMGLEALSRGAKSVTFVEKDTKIISLLNTNIKKAGFASQSRLIRANAFKIGAPVDFDSERYSIIFVDPPYSMTKDVALGSPLDGLFAILQGQLAQDGIVIVRTDKSTELLEAYSRLQVIDRRLWGSMAIAILGCRRDDE